MSAFGPKRTSLVARRETKKRCETLLFSICRHAAARQTAACMVLSLERSDGGVPRRRNPTVTVAALLDVAEGRKRKMESLYTNLICCCHIVELAPRLLS